MKKKIQEMFWSSYDEGRLKNLDLNKIDTPSYVIDEYVLEKNLKILEHVKNETGCKILLAQKAFSAFSVYPLISKYLDGVCASGINEARLGKEFFKKEIHVFGPAYKDSEFDELLKISNHIIFNSYSQIERFKDKIKLSKNIEFGLRVNPEYSEIDVDMYNPSAKFSRLGATINELKGKDLSMLSGIHFHVLCEQKEDTLIRVLKVFEKKFFEILKLPNIKWVNFGGGHHITRNDYGVKKLIDAINDFKKRHSKQVILEPGEAIGLNAGILVGSVFDLKFNGKNIAIIDVSPTCHMPDTIEMPYRPVIGSSVKKGKYLYRLGGPTCLAGDVIGDYSFDKPLNISDKLIFYDMAIYTMVKNTTFNGINLPSIYLYKNNGEIILIKKFGYEDFKNRLS